MYFYLENYLSIVKVAYWKDTYCEPAHILVLSALLSNRG